MVAVAPPLAPDALEVAAARLAALLTFGGGQLADAGGGRLEFETDISPRPLGRGEAPTDAWAVDGGQALVADARSVQLVATRASRVRMRQGVCVLEDEGRLRAHLLGSGQDGAAVASLGLGLPADSAVDLNLLRERWEWEALARCVEEAEPGALVLVDGDLEADWRLPASCVAGVLARAAERQVTLAGVTKRSGLSRGGAPLLGQLELEAERALGRDALWWTPVARLRTGDIEVPVLAARLDPQARFSFRVDLAGAGATDPPATLASLSALCDDAGFPGYPYPLTVADRLAACPRWLRHELWLQLDDLLDRGGVAQEVRERAFADRHDLMERA